jgi:spermidine synthase
MSHKQRFSESRFFSIPVAPTVLARHATKTGEIQLQRRMLENGEEVFEIISDGVFLMSSQFHTSELALAEQALARIENVPCGERRVLIGGLGMGFTLQKALENTIDRVDVVEISHHVIDWNRRHFAQLNDNALSDPRTHLVNQDIDSVLGQAEPASYAAIILDVDNGPSWLAHERNSGLYTSEALAVWSALLLQGGAFSVWSAQPEPDFLERMKRHFDDVTEIEIRLTDEPDRPRSDFLYRGIGGYRGEPDRRVPV